MKVDKDALLKQKFWLLLGVFALLWIICLSALYANAGGPVDKAKKDFDDAKTGITKFTGANAPKNDSFLPPWVAYKLRFEKHKDAVWKVAWNGDKIGDGEAPSPGQLRWEGQKGIYTWPSSNEFPLEAELLYPDSMKSDGKSPAFDVDARQWYKTKEAYGSQFDRLYIELKGDRERPDPDKPLGAVDFKGGYEAVMQPVDWDKSQKPPDIEECWLAQEDFWVRRELLYTLRDALAAAARLDPGPGKTDSDPKDAKEEKPPTPDGKLARQVFHNASWEVELLFDKSPKGVTRISPDSSIKNIHVSHRDQELGSAVNRGGVRFRLLQNGQPVREFALVGEKLAWQQSSKFDKDAGKDGFEINADPTRPLELEQVFDPTNTPIPAVDEIKIPYLSHRNANRPLIPTNSDRYGKHDAPPAGAPPTTPTPGAPGLPPVASGAPPMTLGSSGGPLGGPMGAPGQAADDLTSNKTLNIHRNRYIFVTDQSRHLPLAMTLTMDQSHLGDILVAVANSRLRFQTTQVEFRRLHGAGQGGSSTPSNWGMPVPASSMGGAASAPPPLSLPGPGFPPTGAAAPAVAAQDNPNLVEVTIYGIASLYERPRAQ